jgi:hypothetical protein
MAKKKTDNEIIDEIIEAMVEETPVEEILPEVEEVLPEVKEVKAKSEHPLVRYHYKGRSINQLAGMFLISEAEVKRIIAEHENL